MIKIKIHLAIVFVEVVHVKLLIVVAAQTVSCQSVALTSQSVISLFVQNNSSSDSDPNVNLLYEIVFLIIDKYILT